MKFLFIVVLCYLAMIFGNPLHHNKHQIKNERNLKPYTSKDEGQNYVTITYYNDDVCAEENAQSYGVNIIWPVGVCLLVFFKFAFINFFFQFHSSCLLCVSG